MRFFHKLLVAIGLLIAGAFAAASVWATWHTAEWRQSACYGGISSGRLEGGKRLPYAGANYSAHSFTMWSIGRASMHGAVRDTIADAYADLAMTAPDLQFVYGEIGWPRGGRFYPHKTHRNGLSVDFFVPLRDASGRASSPPVWLFNAYGYLARYDAQGSGPGGTIDFEAMARHLDALHRAGAKRGVGISRIILEPNLHKKLFATPTGAKLRGKLPFAGFKAWVPHDNHYHVDFRVSCRGGR